MKKILFCGGGTAGHVTLNLALIERLLGRCKIHYLGVGGIERTLIKPYRSMGVSYSEFQGVKLSRKLSPELLLLPVRLSNAIKACKASLQLIKPDLVISKGGYGGLPVVIAAHKLHIPAIAHESDYSLGLANRLSLPYVQKMFAVFQNAAAQAGKKGVYCTPPLRLSCTSGNAENVLKRCNFAPEKPILLVLGGSLGSKAVNKAVFDALDELTIDFNVIAVTGKNKTLPCKEKKGFYQIDFTDNIGDLYACADIALSRAGSNTLSELFANKIPPLLVPLTAGSRGEQLKNARYYEKLGCAEVLTQDKLTPASLTASLKALYLNRKSHIKSISRSLPADSVMQDYIESLLS